MDASEEVLDLLRELRDVQREHLQEYKAFATRALAIQEETVARQASIAVLYKRVLVVAAVVVAGLLGYLMFVLSPMLP